MAPTPTTVCFTFHIDSDFAVCHRHPVAGLKYGKWPPNLGIIGGWAVVLIIVTMGALLAAQSKSATNFLHASYAVPRNFNTAILWGTIVFAYSGLETAGIACSMVPSSSDPHPMAAFLKIVISTLVMLLLGLFLYWLSVRKRRGEFLSRGVAGP